MSSGRTRRVPQSSQEDTFGIQRPPLNPFLSGSARRRLETDFQSKVTAKRVEADEDLRRQKLFQKPVIDEEEILAKRKQLLGQ